MSVAGTRAMGTPFFHELKKQASFFFKEKIKNARLALTDVTPAELLTEEATNGDPWAPDAKTMGFISRSAFEIDDYWRIVEILHKRLSKFDRRHWREPYKAVVILEHLLTHGPESVAEEFQCDREVIQELGTFQYIDERGFNWGLTVRKKSERVLKLLEKGPLLKEERNRARKITRGIEGFGSFNQRWQPSESRSSLGVADIYGRCNSQYEEHDYKEEEALEDQKESSSCQEMEKKEDTADKSLEYGKAASLIEESSVTIKEGLSPEESKPLLAYEENPKTEFKRNEHPFNSFEHQPMESMLLLSQTPC